MTIYSNFFSHKSFSLQKIYNKRTFKTIIVIGNIKSWNFGEVCFNFIRSIHIYPDQLSNVYQFLKDSSFLYG